MKKKLKTNGSKISAFSVVVTPLASQGNQVYDKLVVTVDEGAKRYVYDVYSDTRHPSVALIKNHLDSSFAQATSNFLNVEVTEDKERKYLFVSFQSIGQEQYTGERTA